MKRRSVLRMLAYGAAGGIAGSLGFLRCHGPGRAVQRTRGMMGTVVHLTVLGDDLEAAAHAADSALDRMSGLEGILSLYRADSEVSRLNREGRLENASSALLDVLQLADRVSRMGDGAFDVTVQPLLDLYREHLQRSNGLPAPEAVERAAGDVGFRALRLDGPTVTLDRAGMRITLDGIGKGYIVDRGVSALAELDFPNVFVEAGGDLMAAGEKEGARPWSIGIRSPRPGLSLQARLDARGLAVATSGDYMQPFTEDLSLHHILDPRTGRSAPELASSTVVAPDVATADALATLTMVLGPGRGRALLEDLSDCEGYLISKQLEVTRTSGFPAA